MTAYTCPECGSFMTADFTCLACGAQWGEDHSESGCPNCGSLDYLDTDDDGDTCPHCGIVFTEWYAQHAGER